MSPSSEGVAMRARFLSRLVCVAALLLCGGTTPGQDPPPGTSKPPALTPVQRERLKERDRLAAAAPKLWQAGKQAEALAAWEKKLGIEREVFGKAHEEVAKSLERLA